MNGHGIAIFTSTLYFEITIKSYFIIANCSNNSELSPKLEKS